MQVACIWVVVVNETCLLGECTSHLDLGLFLVSVNSVLAGYVVKPRASFQVSLLLRKHLPIKSRHINTTSEHSDSYSNGKYFINEGL